MAALGNNMGNRVKAENSSKEKPRKKVAKPTAKVSVKKVAVKPAKNTSRSKKEPVATAKKAESKPIKALTKEKKRVSTAKKVSAPKKQKKIAAEVKPVPKKGSAKSSGKKPSLRNAKLILEPSMRKKIRKTKVILEGDLNINNVDAFMLEIEPIFDDYDFVDFFQREVTSIDLSHIQMLNYFKNYPVKKGKTVTINSDVSPEMKKMVITAGFKELLFIPKLV
ncbi:MAG: hypothetical protein ABJG78_00210 [Cyclobacteriaceae bacterium]